MSIDPAVRRVLAAQADIVAEHERRWRRTLAALAADGTRVDAPHREPFAHLAAARHLLGVGVTIALLASRTHGGSGFRDLTYVMTERLLEQARTRLAAPSAYGYRNLCLWCGRDRHTTTGETPVPQAGDERPGYRPDEPDRLWHPSCFTAYQQGRGIIAALYRHCPDHARTLLDDLVTAAGMMRRCPQCAAITPPDEACTGCGAAQHTETVAG